MEIFHTGLNHYLFLSIILISLGLYGMLFRREKLSVIFSFQIIMSGINIMLAAFTKFTAAGNDGYTLAVILAFTSCIQIVSLTVFLLSRPGNDTTEVTDDNH